MWRCGNSAVQRFILAISAHSCAPFALISVVKNISDFSGQSIFLLPAPKKSGYSGASLELVEGAVAQLVEQRTENPCVGGSIPPHTTL